MSIADDIADALSKAKKLKAGDNERESHSLADMIAAAKYLANLSQATGNGRKIVINKLRPPGTS